MNINNAKLEDIEIIKEVYNNTLVKIGGRFFAFYTDIDAIKRKIIKNNIFVISDNDKIIGVFSLKWNKKSCEIVTLAIIEEYRKNGIGKQIIKYIINLSINKDKKNIKVWTNKKFKAIDFYVKCGFRKIIYEYSSESCLLERRL